MTSRERFRAAMAHNQPDRVPIDLACTSLTGMTPFVQERLKEVLGLTGEGSTANHGIDNRLLEWAGCDFRSVGSIASLRGTLAQRISDDAYVDEWGIERRLVDGRWSIARHPLAEATVDDLARFPWPSPELDDAQLEAWREEARRLATETPYVVIGEHPVFGVLELGCWMCGYDVFLLRMAMDPDFVKAFSERYLSLQSRVIDQYYGAIGEYIDLTMSGDDFGMQTGPMMSPDMFRELVAPWFRERIARTKDRGRCYYWHHSCGSVAALLDDIVACEVDILNPIQTSAADMSPAALKASHGDRLTFWGAIDTQDLLRTATPDEVRAEVAETVRVLGRDGGYVLAPAHNIQDDVPPQNIVAMIEAARDAAETELAEERSRIGFV